MTLDQISEYIEAWSEQAKKSNVNNQDINTMIDPTVEEMELFHISAGIDRVKVPKKK